MKTPPVKLKALFFDVDDTLCATTAFTVKARAAAVDAMRSLGLRHPRASLIREQNEVIEEFSSNYGLHLDKLLLRLPPKSFKGINRAILVAAGVRAYHDAKDRLLRPFPDVPNAIRRLARTRLRLGVITAGLEIKQADKLLRLDLYDQFDPGAIFISEQIGISKPNPKLFQRACDAVGVKPTQAGFIGDHPTHDIDPAHEIGMVTFRVRRGRLAGAEGRSTPDHDLQNFKELLTVLRRIYKVPT